LLSANIEKVCDLSDPFSNLLYNYKPEHELEVKWNNGLVVYDHEGTPITSEENPEGQGTQDYADLTLGHQHEFIAVLGFGDGYLVEEIAHHHPNSQIGVLEPDLDILHKVMSSRELELKAGQVLVFHDPVKFKTSSFFGYSPFKTITLAGTMYYAERFPGMAELLRDTVQEFQVYSQIGDLTANSRIKTWISHLLTNVEAHSLRPSIVSLQGKFQGVPAVLVAAGPSLDKNIELLKKWPGVIICCSHAYHALVKHNITPHFVTVIEATDCSAMFEGAPVEETSLVTLLTTHPNHLTFSFKHIFTMTDMYPIYASWMRELGDWGGVHIGGSVANFSYSVADFLGCNVIAVVGQDLAYTDDKMYAGGVIGDEISLESGKNDENPQIMTKKALNSLTDGLGMADANDQVETLEVKSWDGQGKVRTSNDFRYFKNWFEKEGGLAVKMGKRICNCTEGGAYIENWEHLPLLDLIVSLEEVPELPTWEALPVREGFHQNVREGIEKQLQELREIEPMVMACHRRVMNLLLRTKKGRKKLLKGFDKATRGERRLLQRIHGNSLLYGYLKPGLSNVIPNTPQVIQWAQEDKKKAIQANLFLSKYLLENIADGIDELSGELKKALKGSNDEPTDEGTGSSATTDLGLE
jgi:hypothetical protein